MKADSFNGRDELPMPLPVAAAATASWQSKQVAYVLLFHLSSLVIAGNIGFVLEATKLSHTVADALKLSSVETATVLMNTFCGQILFLIALWFITPPKTLRGKLRLWGLTSCRLGQAGMAVLLGGVAAILFIYLTVLFPPTTAPIIQKLFANRNDMIFLGFNAVLLAPVVEEIFFRGIIFSYLREKQSLWAATSLTAIFFVAVHIPQLWPYTLGMVLVGSLGILLTLVKALTSSTTLSWLVHLVYNLIWCMAVIPALWYQN